MALALFYPGAILFQALRAFIGSFCKLIAIYERIVITMAKELYVVKFSYEAEFIAGAIEDFVASNVFGMDTEDPEYEPPYDVGVEEVFDDEVEALKYFNTIKNVLKDMGYQYSMSNRTIIVEEPVKEQYIALETIEVTSQKVPAWATMYEDFVSRKD